MKFTTDPKTTPIEITKTYEFTAVLSEALQWRQENGDREPIPGCYVAGLELWAMPGAMLTIKVDVFIEGEYEHAEHAGDYGFLDITATMQNLGADIEGKSLDWNWSDQKQAWEYLSELWIEDDAQGVAMKEVG